MRKVSTDPMIQEWFEVYTQYLRYFQPDAEEIHILTSWSSHTNNLIDYYHNTPSVWGDDFIKFLRCQIDHYKRQNEHLVYIGHKDIAVKPSNGGRYWK